MDGFHIVDACDPVSPVERRYENASRDVDGPRHPVTVACAPRVVEEASAETGQSLTARQPVLDAAGRLAKLHFLAARRDHRPTGGSTWTGSPATCCARRAIATGA